MELDAHARFQGLVVLSTLNTFKQAGIHHGYTHAEQIIQDVVFPQLRSLGQVVPRPYRGPPASAYTTNQDRVYVVTLLYCEKLLLALAAAEQRPIHPDNMYMSVIIPFFEEYAAALREVVTYG